MSRDRATVAEPLFAEPNPDANWMIECFAKAWRSMWGHQCEGIVDQLILCHGLGCCGEGEAGWVLAGIKVDSTQIFSGALSESCTPPAMSYCEQALYATQWIGWVIQWCGDSLVPASLSVV